MRILKVLAATMLIMFVFAGVASAATSPPTPGHLFYPDPLCTPEFE